MNFIWRIAYINDQGVCIIGMKKESMLPLISLDVVINVGIYEHTDLPSLKPI